MQNVRTSKATRDGKALPRLHTLKTSEPQEISELERELLSEQEKTKKLEENLKKSQDSMVKKEIANKKCLQEFEEKILGRGSGSLLTLEKIQDYHSEIQSKLELVQYKTLRILIEQEKELIQEYRDEFLEDDEKKNQLRRDLLSKPKAPNKDLVVIREIENENLKFQLLDKEINEETEKNFRLKLDHAERKKEIQGMKIMVDQLRLERENLRKTFQTARFSQKLPSLNSRTERSIVPQKDSKFLMIEKLKQEVETCKRENKAERLKLFKLQESTTEAKFLLKRTIQDLNDLIEKGGNSVKSSELIEKSKIIAKIYDATFPVKASLSSRVFSMPKPQVSDFESTMQQIQSLYENYERSLRSKLAH